MATVYLAFDIQSENWCAIKVLRDQFVKKESPRRRFESEARILQKLDHRNIIKCLAANTEVDPPWMVLELAEGGCLIDWIDSHGNVPPRMAVDVGIQICKGLAAAHDAGIVHRDVKPHNILMNHRGVCKLTDFGIAQGDALGPDLTRTDTALGTLGYVAPEQRANAKSVDHRADIYSAGATIYAMITGEASADLFVADRVTELMADVPPPLRPVIMAATTYRPDERFLTAHEFARSLHEARGQLLPDPSQTPQLALRRDEALDRPAPSVGVPAPAPASKSIPEVVPPKPPDGGNPLANVRRYAIVSALALVSFFGLLGAGMAALQMGSTQTQATQVREAYFDKVEASEPLLDKLESLGSHRPVLQSKWDDWTAAKSAEDKDRAAHAYSAALAADIAKHTQNPSPGTRVTARTVISTLEEIQAAEAASDRAEATAAASGCSGK